MAVRIWTGEAGDNDLENPANWRPLTDEDTSRPPFFEVVITGKSLVQSADPVYQADAMPAGCELDALVAEHVMEWLPMPGGHTLAAAQGWYRDDGDGTAVWVDKKQFQPSTDMAAAWAVIKVTRSRDWWWEVESHYGKDGGWEGSAWTEHKSDPEGTRVICWEAETPELAICRVALAAALQMKGRLS